MLTKSNCFFLFRKGRKVHGLLLTSSQDELVHDSVDAATAVQQFAGSSHWETLELYLVRIFYALLSFCQCSIWITVNNLGIPTNEQNDLCYSIFLGSVWFKENTR